MSSLPSYREKADRLAHQSAMIRPEREQYSSLRKQGHYALKKKRLSDEASQIEERIVRGRVTDKVLLNYSKSGKFLVLPDKTLSRFRKDISLDKVFTFPSHSAIANYWNDVFRRISDGLPEPPESDFDEHDRNFLPDLTPSRLRDNTVDLWCRKKTTGMMQHWSRLTMLLIHSRSPLEEFLPAKKLPAHMGFGCRVHFAENELAFLRVRATDDRNHDWLSPVFCTDSFGSHVIFQHWGYPWNRSGTLLGLF